MDPAELLALAAISYRGCELNLSDLHSRKIVYDEMARCLRTFPSVHDRWAIAWGPAGFSSALVGPDTSAMYVVRGTESPSNLAIIIRGTNYFSLEDFLSDLPIDPKQWKYGGAGTEVAITHSTAYGLSILQRLKAEPVPPPDAPQTAEEITRATAVAAEGTLAYALLNKILRGEEPASALTLEETLRTRIEHLLDSAEGLAGSEVAALERAETAQPPAGITLLDFLKQYISDATSPVNIWVVGHSKGGALAPALALWLADIRNTGETDDWDPRRTARLNTATFAAPTPGNIGFAQRFQRQMTNAYRLANPGDIVPHVWNPEDLRKIPGLYGLRSALLGPAALVLAHALRAFDYQHPCAAEPWVARPLPDRPLYAQIVINHLDVYLQQLGIYDAQVNTLAVLDTSF